MQTQYCATFTSNDAVSKACFRDARNDIQSTSLPAGRNVKFDGVSVVKAGIPAERIPEGVLVGARGDAKLEFSFQGHTEVTKVIECKNKMFGYL